MTLPDIIEPHLCGFTHIGFIERSLFGCITHQVHIQTDTHVAIKHSLRSSLVGGCSTNIRVNNLTENVEREVRILQYLHASSRSSLCRMAQLAGVINGLSERTTIMLCVNQTAQRSVYRGRKYIVKCLGAWYDKTCFHSAFEHLTGGDVFNLFNEFPSRFLGVNNVRRMFVQLCRAVQFMHANCIAHLDIGVENMCIDNKGTVRLIDFGLAVQHPAVRQLLQSPSQNATCTIASNDPFGSPHIKLLHPNTHIVSTCRQSKCKSCRQTFLRDRMPSPTEASFEVRRSMPFMCRPICLTKSSPGKPNCMAPEVFGRECFDAYAADCFSLGCVLYILSTGSRAFNVPTHDDDGFAKLYNNPRADEFMPSIIHSDARDLIRSLLVSQEQRPTIDVILQHPFLMKQ